MTTQLDGPACVMIPGCRFVDLLLLDSAHVEALLRHLMW